MATNTLDDSMQAETVPQFEPVESISTSDIQKLLPIFDGTSNVTTWIKELEAHFEVFNIAEKKKLFLAYRQVTGNAMRFLKSEALCMDWQSFKIKIEEEFKSDIIVSRIYENLQKMTIGEEESVIHFYYRLLEAGSQIKLDVSDLVRFFLKGAKIRAERNWFSEATSREDLKKKIKIYAMSTEDFREENQIRKEKREFVVPRVPMTTKPGQFSQQSSNFQKYDYHNNRRPPWREQGNFHNLPTQASGQRWHGNHQRNDFKGPSIPQRNQFNQHQSYHQKNGDVERR